MTIRFFYFSILLLLTLTLNAQVGIGTETPNASSLLELSSTSKGLLVPRMTEAQKNAISSPAQGLLIYQTDGTIGFYNHDGSNWSPLIQSSSSTPTFLYGTENVLLDGTTSPSVGTMHRSVGLGYLTLNSVTSGNKNVAIGSNAMRRNTSGEKNVGIGWTALTQNTQGSRNVAIGGSEALDANTTGSDNVAIGDRAMTYNTTGQANIAIGYLSLGNNDAGNYNTMIGYGAGSNIRTESGNTGNDNVGMGYRALELNYSGDGNVAIGWDALRATKGSGNLGIGYDAGDTNSTGSNNSLIGKNADVASNNLTNATALGYNAIVNASNKVRLGDTNVTNIETSGTITAGAITYPNTDGTANQVLKTNGSGSLSWTTVGGPVYGSSVVTQGSSTAAADSQIDLPGMSFRWNSGKLEIKGESGNSPQAMIFYFSYHTNSGNTVNFRPDTVSFNSNSWSPVNCSWCSNNPNLPSITGSYAVYEFDFSVYPLNTSGKHYGRTYNIKILLGGWGGVHMRAFYQ